jgi:hypothetical protein
MPLSELTAGVEVHAYAVSDTEATNQKCALLAEERAPRGFYGFRTHDAATVAYIVDHPHSRSGALEQ